MKEPIKWEYKAVNCSEPLSTDGLNVFGQDGWEMCGYHVIQYRDCTPVYQYIFKRPNIDE